MQKTTFFLRIFDYFLPSFPFSRVLSRSMDARAVLYIGKRYGNQKVHSGYQREQRRTKVLRIVIASCLWKDKILQKSATRRVKCTTDACNGTAVCLALVTATQQFYLQTQLKSKRAHHDKVQLTLTCRFFQADLVLCLKVSTRRNLSSNLQCGGNHVLKPLLATTETVG